MAVRRGSTKKCDAASAALKASAVAADNSSAYELANLFRKVSGARI
jgi:hypothetical protein